MAQSTPAGKRYWPLFRVARYGCHGIRAGGAVFRARRVAGGRCAETLAALSISSRHCYRMGRRWSSRQTNSKNSSASWCVRANVVAADGLPSTGSRDEHER